jgi:hypothetical protein
LISLDRFHIVSINKDHNKLNNKDTGKGRISVRVNNEKDLQSLQKKFQNIGVKIEADTHTNKLKSNYIGLANLDWTDRHLQKGDLLDVRTIHCIPDI